MLRGMSARQLADWRAYYAKEPRGERRGDWQAALVCATLFNAAELIRSGKTKFRFKPEEFLLVFSGLTAAKEGEGKKPATTRPVQDFSQMKMAARMWAAVANADEKKRKRKR